MATVATSGKRSGARLAAVALVCLAVFAVAAAPALAEKPHSGKQPAKHSEQKAWSPDPSFAGGGGLSIDFPSQSGGEGRVKYVLPYQFTPGHLEMAQAPGGKIVVAGATKVVRALRNGKHDNSFGNHGEVLLARPPGMTFVLAAVAVDSRGRVLLAGSARPLPTSSTPDPLLSRAMVVRLSADGSFDPSFGEGGVLLTDFGFGAPKAAGGPYPGPAVGLRGMVVDSQDRPVLSGGYVSELGDCGRNGAVSTGFVARLTESGQLDPSFGDGGLRTVANLASFGQIGLTPAGQLLALGNGAGYCNGHDAGPANALVRFSEGNLDPSFGFSGFRVIGGLDSPVMTIAPSGKIVLLGAVQRGRKRVRQQPLLRLLPSGVADPSFSRIGTTLLTLGKGQSVAALAVDPRGRILLAGRLSKRVSKKPKNPLRRSSFLLARMNADGTIDRSFGIKGSAASGFGGKESIFATQVMLGGRGRILVGGGITTPNLPSGGGYSILPYLERR